MGVFGGGGECWWQKSLWLLRDFPAFLLYPWGIPNPRKCETGLPETLLPGVIWSCGRGHQGACLPHLHPLPNICALSILMVLGSWAQIYFEKVVFLASTAPKSREYLRDQTDQELESAQLLLALWISQTHYINLQELINGQDLRLYKYHLHISKSHSVGIFLEPRTWSNSSKGWSTWRPGCRPTPARGPPTLL